MAVDNVGFRLQTPVLINTVPHTRPPPALQPGLGLQCRHSGTEREEKMCICECVGKGQGSMRDETG